MVADMRERDDVISTNYASMSELKRRIAELEKHKFVLSHRVQVKHK